MTIISDESINFIERLGSPDTLVNLAWGGQPNFRGSNSWNY